MARHFFHNRIGVRSTARMVFSQIVAQGQRGLIGARVVLQRGQQRDIPDSRGDGLNRLEGGVPPGDAGGTDGGSGGGGATDLHRDRAGNVCLHGAVESRGVVDVAMGPGIGDGGPICRRRQRIEDNRAAARWADGDGRAGPRRASQNNH